MAEDLENILGSHELNEYEIYRKSVFALREVTVPDEETFENISNFKKFTEKFLSIVERYYEKLFKIYQENYRGYKPLFKLIEIFELMLENFSDDNYMSQKENAIS